MSFLSLSDFDHLRSNPTVQFKDEIVGGVPFTTIAYMVSNPDLWTLLHGEECRGITFRTDTGELASLPFHKFFNLNENKFTLEENIDWTLPFEVLNKNDGSMITPVFADGKIYFKTKKSFHSDVAVLANKLAPDSVRDFCMVSLSQGFCPIFEFYHPDWRVVVDYGNEPTWTLLAIRNMSNGEYLSHTEMDMVSDDYQGEEGDEMELVQLLNLPSLPLIKESIDNMKNLEGYVIHFPPFGIRVKLKCKDYLNKHHVRTDLRERDLIKMIRDEEVDDIIPVIVECGYDLTEVDLLQKRYTAELKAILSQFNTLKDLIVKSGLAGRELYETFGNEPYFALATKVIRNPEYDIKATKLWSDKHLVEYSLRTIYSDFNHNTEEV